MRIPVKSVTDEINALKTVRKEKNPITRKLLSEEIAALKGLSQQLQKIESKDLSADFKKERATLVRVIDGMLKDTSLLTPQKVMSTLDFYTHVTPYIKKSEEYYLLTNPEYTKTDPLSLDDDDVTALAEQDPLDETKLEFKINAENTLIACKQILDSLAKQDAKQIEKIEKNLKIEKISEAERYNIFIGAIRNNKIITVYLLLKSGLNPNFKMDDLDNNPLAVAISDRRHEIIILLIEMGKIKVNESHLSRAVDYLPHQEKGTLAPIIIRKLQQTTQYPSKYHQAAFEGTDLSIFEEMKSDADFFVKDFKGMTPFHYLCASGNIATMKAYMSVVPMHLKKKVIETKDNEYLQPPVFWILEHNHANFFRELYQVYPFDLKMTTWDTETPLIMDAHNVEMLELLHKEYKLPVDSKNKGGNTLLLRLSYVNQNEGFDHLGLMQKLAEYKADINVANNNSDTPLILAVHNNYFDRVKCLLLHGAAPNKPTKGGYVPIEYVRSFEVADYLRRHGADIYFSKDGITCLHSSDSEVAVEYLLQHGLDPNTPCAKGDTPLFWSHTWNLKIVKLLINYGANLSARSSSEETPLQRALRGHSGDSVYHLRMHGAPIDAGVHQELTKLIRNLNHADHIHNKDLNSNKCTYILMECYKDRAYQSDFGMFIGSNPPKPYLSLIKYYFFHQEKPNETRQLFQTAFDECRTEGNNTQKVFTLFYLGKLCLEQAEAHGFNYTAQYMKTRASAVNFLYIRQFAMRAAHCFLAAGVDEYRNGYNEMVNMAFRCENLIQVEFEPGNEFNPKFKPNMDQLQLSSLKKLQLEIIKLIPEDAELSAMAHLQMARLIRRIYDSLKINLDKALEKSIHHAKMAYILAQSPELKREAYEYYTVLEIMQRLPDEPKKLDFIEASAKPDEDFDLAEEKELKYGKDLKDEKVNKDIVLVNGVKFIGLSDELGEFTLEEGHVALSSKSKTSLSLPSVVTTSAAPAEAHPKTVNIFQAVQKNDLEKLKELLEQDADLAEQVEEKTENTPLFYAKTKEAAELLLQYGASANAINCNGETPLHHCELPEIAQLLMDFKAYPKVNYSDRVPVDLAIEQANLGVVKVMVSSSVITADQFPDYVKFAIACFAQASERVPLLADKREKFSEMCLFFLVETFKQDIKLRGIVKQYKDEHDLRETIDRKISEKRHLKARILTNIPDREITANFNLAVLAITAASRKKYRSTKRRLDDAAGGWITPYILTVCSTLKDHFKTKSESATSIWKFWKRYRSKRKQKKFTKQFANIALTHMPKPSAASASSVDEEKNKVATSQPAEPKGLG